MIRTPSSQTLLIAAIALTTMLAPLNSTMIAVALPEIMSAFHADVAAAGWLVTAYLLTMASVQPVAGKLGDQWGRRRLVLGGLIYFALASLGAALSPSLGLLTFFRVQQAIAAAVALPNGMALLRDVIPAEQRGRQFGMIGAAAGLAAAAGPPLGGLLVGLGGWQMIFTANVALVVPALLIGWWAIPADRKTQQRSRSFDWPGALWLTALLVALAWWFSAQRKSGLLLNGQTLFVLAGFGLLLALFALYEARRADAVLPPRLFRSRSFAAANATVATSNLAMYVTLLAVPLLLTQQLGWDSAHTGYALAAMSGAMLLMAPLGGRLADRWGRRRPVVLGLALAVVGLFPLTFTHGDPSLPLLLACLGLTGIGMGLSGAGMHTAAIEAVPPAQTGVAAGVYSTSRYLGSITGASLLPVLLGGAAGVYRFDAVFVLVTLSALLSALFAFGIAPREKSPALTESAGDFRSQHPENQTGESR